MSDFQLSLLCLLVTLGLYFANKRLYRRFHKLPLMPLVFTPILLVMMLVFGHISYQRYMGRPTGCCGCWARRRSPLPCRYTTTWRLLSATGCR